MHFVIHCLDRHGAVQTRLDHYDRHKAYLAQAKVKSLVSGPLVADDGQTMIGSFFLVEADSKADVVAFNADDPFASADIWERVDINPFLKRVDNR